ncbi:TetR/AcrR family transcriptional regulator [Amycolatopsis pigmentata]|uniref:TetR/AcrR family transcriptional regulator n=1 Tax=Amycolatopsis pigmentata TaxID=450801 RepID=A0ABW5G1M1_9PSEU
MAAVTDLSARERLLDAAERLFLESGCDGVSVRAINAAAGMNPAAVHYHFGSREDLVSALLESRLAPLWERPLAELARRAAPSPEELADVVITPLAALAKEPSGRLYLHLLARTVLGDHRPAWTSRWFGLTPWAGLLRSSQPGLSTHEAKQRWTLAFQLILHTFGAPLAAGPLASAPSAAAVRRLRAFVTAGLTSTMGER